MKSIGGLWPEIVAFDNLYAAWRKARRGKADRISVAAFGRDLEPELLRLVAELRDGSYRPGRYRLFTVYERKPRQIAAAPFRDRVVHHAIMNHLEPALDNSLIEDCYACRKGKGAHRAMRRYQAWSRRYPYAMKMDIASYFASIDHQILKSQLGRKLREQPLLDLLGRIIDSGPAPSAPPQWFPGDDLLTPVERPRGIPIGNLTSQFLANFHLNGLDHFIKEVLRVPGYLRYVDDMILLGERKRDLWRWHGEIVQYLADLRLRLHPRKTRLAPVASGMDVLGYRVFPNRIELRNDNGHRFARKLRGMARAWSQDRYTLDDFKPSIASWVGHASHADSDGLRQRIFATTVFNKGVLPHGDRA